MKRTFLYAGICCLLVSSLCYHTARAQVTLGAQLRTRTEFRDGQGAPLPQGANPAVFTSQRSRLMAGFNSTRLKVGFTVQDVRVWGQDVSTINRTTTADLNGFMLHETWAEVLLSDTAHLTKTFSLKIGRQEFVYDDSRLLGNLDWLQQGRHHDAALLKYETPQWALHVAGAFNQNKENASGTMYNETPPGNYTSNTNGGAAYKGLEFAYGKRKLKDGSASFLFLADQFSTFHTDSTTGLKSYGNGTFNRMTTGVYFTKSVAAFTITASAYYQFGHNASGQTIDGELISAALFFNPTKTFSIGPGVDYTSGGSNGSTSHAFDPLYGTPHRFWGNMDYYYVASGFGNHGLQDYYLKTKWKPGAKWNLALDGHQFLSASNVPGAGHSYSRNFGTEADLQANYTFTKAIAFEAGYSHYWSTDALTSATVKNVVNAKSNSNWAYLMIIIHPEVMLK